MSNKEEVEEFLDVDARSLSGQLNARMGPRYARLNEAIAGLVDEFSMVSFFPLDYTEEESLQDLLAYIDNSIQYGEDEEIRDQIKDMEDPEDGRQGV